MLLISCYFYILHCLSFCAKIVLEKRSNCQVATILVFQFCQLCVKLSDMDDFFRSLIRRVGLLDGRDTETRKESGILET